MLIAMMEVITLTLASEFFFQRQRFNRKSNKIVIGQFNALKVGHILVNSQLTILNRFLTFVSQLEDSVYFGGLWNALDLQIQICPISDFLTFGKISDFLFFLSQNCSINLIKRARDLLFSSKMSSKHVSFIPTEVFPKILCLKINLKLNKLMGIQVTWMRLFNQNVETRAIFVRRDLKMAKMRF